MIPDGLSLAVMWMALALLSIGLFNRKNRKVHIFNMAIGLATVYVLVLALQITKRVIGKAAAGNVPDMPDWLMAVHVGMALVFIALSVVMISTGLKKARNYATGPGRRLMPVKRQRVDLQHRACGITAYGAMWVVALTAPGSVIAQLLPK